MNNLAVEQALQIYSFKQIMLHIVKKKAKIIITATNFILDAFDTDSKP